MLYILEFGMESVTLEEARKLYLKYNICKKELRDKYIGRCMSKLSKLISIENSIFGDENKEEVLKLASRNLKRMSH